MVTKQRADLTFRDNLRRGRHGWIRLTPAYSVKIVHEILEQYPDIHSVCEPFSGTGTTGLVAAELGLKCDLYDINPFLVWLTSVKCANYSKKEVSQASELGAALVSHAKTKASQSRSFWTPPISSIDRWWHPSRLETLASIYDSLNDLLPNESPTKNLFLVAFCRLTMQWSNAAHNHQSLSFKEPDSNVPLFSEVEEIFQSFLANLKSVLHAAIDPISGVANVYLEDSRNIKLQASQQYDAVITSPPYPNRMSYIRELRPYMYWLGFLTKASEAGVLDWKAIGGTWGIATSKLLKWEPESNYQHIPSLTPVVEQVAPSSELLSRYLLKYFIDMSEHFSSLYDAVAPGGRIFYIVGNSKFYDTLVPVEQLYAEIMGSCGFEDTTIRTIRKRNSKKELYEFLVSARKPA